MKSTRRLLSIILCLIMCLSLLPVSAFAAANIMTAGKAGPNAQFKLYTDGKLVVNEDESMIAVEIKNIYEISKYNCVRVTH